MRPSFCTPRGSLRRELAPRFYRALREEPFGYRGTLLGREIVAEHALA